MVKACFLIKYPPIEGGVSMRGYWLAREMAERGHQIFVVTNANEVEDEYRMFLDEDDKPFYELNHESGGFVRVFHTEPFDRKAFHIPQTNPFVTKLSSIATQVIRRHGCEVIFAQYLQPYGLAAYLASQWTGVPYMVKHAGSDIGRLMKQRDMATALREVLKAADCVWGGLSDEVFGAMGVQRENLWPGISTAPVPAIFSPDTPALDLNRLLGRLSESGSKHVRGVVMNTSTIDMSKPSVGIYGKVGETKGSFDLVAALGILKRRGLDFNFFSLTQGGVLDRFKSAIRDEDLQDRTWTFPFIPHWKVPGFIRACSVVCFLERDFPITFHSPGIAKEIQACGTCLILSGEIAKKQRNRDRLVNGLNVLLIDDPKNREELASQVAYALENPERAAAIGLEGRKAYAPLMKTRNRKKPRTLTDVFEEKLIAVRDAGRRSSSSIPAPQISDDRRRARLMNRLPLAFVLLKGQWDALLAQYCEATQRDGKTDFEDAVGFCEFLESRADTLNGETCLPDVLRYERIHNSMLLDRPQNLASTQDMDDRIKLSFDPKWDNTLRKSDKEFDPLKVLRPVQSRTVRVESFNCDLPGVLSSLREGRLPLDIGQRKTTILFKKEMNFVNLELAIGELTESLLRYCDGSKTADEIVAAVVQSSFPAGLTEAEKKAAEDGIRAALRDFYAKSIVKGAKAGGRARRNTSVMTHAGVAGSD